MSVSSYLLRSLHLLGTHAEHYFRYPPTSISLYSHQLLYYLLLYLLRDSTYLTGSEAALADQILVFAIISPTRDPLTPKSTLVGFKGRFSFTQVQCWRPRASGCRVLTCHVHVRNGIGHRVSVGILYYLHITCSFRVASPSSNLCLFPFRHLPPLYKLYNSFLRLLSCSPSRHLLDRNTEVWQLSFVLRYIMTHSLFTSPSRLRLSRYRIIAVHRLLDHDTETSFI